MSQSGISKNQIFYTKQGKGPPVVLISGLSGLASFWHPQIPSLVNRFTTVTYDHGGLGRSTGCCQNTIEGMSKELLDLLDHIGLDEVSMVGHSTGGAIAQCFAATWPSRVRRLVLSSTWSKSDERFIRLFVLRRDVLNCGDVELYARLSTLLVYPASWVSQHSRSLLAEEKQFAGRAEITTLSRRIDALLAFDGGDYSPKIQCPTLVFASKDDAVIPCYMTEALCRAISDAEFHFSDTGGHYFPTTKAAEYNQILRAFLA